MKEKNKQLLILVSLLGALWSCEKEIPYEGDDSESLLVLNQVIEKDSTFSIGIERSRFLLESFTTNTALDDALVTLNNTTTGASETLVAGSNGRYDFAMVAEEGHSYEVTASHNDYPTVTGSDVIPSTISLISVDTNSFNNENFERIMEAKFKWNDPQGKNYYMLTVQSNQSFPQRLYLGSDDISITNGGTNFDGDETFDYFFALNDESFDGTQKELTLQFGHFLFGSGIEYQYQLYHCTEDAYKYLISASLSENSGTGPFVEAVKVSTNIEGGYGIFGAINKSQIIK